jgi:hypothetical protein
MNGRNIPLGPDPKEQIIETVFKGRAYRICSRGQMEYALMYQRVMIMEELANAGKAVVEAEVDQLLAKWKEEQCPVIDLDTLFSKMTPAEKKQWQDSYRFGGIFKSLPRD